jgi:hypothetical protein
MVMRPEHARNIALAFGAALLLLWSAAATTVIRHTAPPATLRSVTSTDAAAVPFDENAGATHIVESVLAFVREITRSLERGDYTGAVIRLLIIVEVLIAALGAVSTVTVRGKVKADLVYRIVDVMGALFILIALLLLGLTAGSLTTPRR